MSTNRTFVSILAACAALLAVGCADGSAPGALATDVPPPADVKPAKWNQERVTAIAVELADAVRDLRQAFRATPIGNTVGSGQEAANLRMRDRLRLLSNESQHLANELKNGASREATRSVYERVGVIARDTREEARKMFIPGPLMDSIISAGAVWRRLTPYYVGV